MNENIFVGLQKLTLLDYPGKVACTLFTRGCNFRCPFCHNASLVVRAEEQKSYENSEILAFLKKRQGILDPCLFAICFLFNFHLAPLFSVARHLTIGARFLRSRA